MYYIHKSIQTVYDIVKESKYLMEAMGSMRENTEEMAHILYSGAFDAL